jgi:AP-3 complex subunit delta-1
MECIDSPDISIRLRALDLVVGMVNSDNLMSIVGRLMRQLKNSRTSTTEQINHQPSPIEPAADSDDESPEVIIKTDKGASEAPLLPDDYKVDIITRILGMCSSNNYGNLVDFDWYIDILIQLVRSAPLSSPASIYQTPTFSTQPLLSIDVSERIGDELRSIAVKVKAIRPQASRAAESILISTYNESSSMLTAGSGVLRPVAWIVGEYASTLDSPDSALTALLQLTKISTVSDSLIIYLQALPKIFSTISQDTQIMWTPERKTMVSLLMARIIHSLEPLALHPDLEVQERSVEFSELLKLAAEASNSQDASSDTMQHDAPLLLTHAIPSLFIGIELNSVAAAAQKNVPLPPSLDLDRPINSNLGNLLKAADALSVEGPEEDEFEAYYHQLPPSAQTGLEPAIRRIATSEEPVHSYQQSSEESYLDADIVARRRAERLERNKDDPFYIAPIDDRSGRSTPLHNIIQSNQGPDLDLDSIPIMQLDLGKADVNPSGHLSPQTLSVPKHRQRIQVAADETLANSGNSTPWNDDSENSLEGNQRPKPKGKQSLLQVDSSHIGAFSLEGNSSEGVVDFERQQREEAEMQKAMLEVEKLRLEMQRANERVQAAKGVEGMVVKKKKKKNKLVETSIDEQSADAVAIAKKKKKVKRIAEDQGSTKFDVVTDVVKSKKKKKEKKVRSSADQGTTID